MYEIENIISTGSYKGLTVDKLTSDDNCEALLITLEEACHFPEHTSPRNALLVMLEGVILFTISKKIIHYKSIKPSNFLLGKGIKWLLWKTLNF
jgi:quercetin dioxygenase-like cupin family protein